MVKLVNPADIPIIVYMGFEKEALKKTTKNYIQDPLITISGQVLKNIDKVLEYSKRFEGFYLLDSDSLHRPDWIGIQASKIDSRKRTKLAGYEHHQINGELVLPDNAENLEAMLEQGIGLARFENGNKRMIPAAIMHNGLFSWHKHFQLEGISLIGYGKDAILHQNYSQRYDWQECFPQN